MPIKVVPYTPDEVPAVRAFNQRMADGNTGWGWYEEAVDDWLPRQGEQPVWREHYVAVDENAEVRGAYALKPQEWRVRGESVLVTDWQGPVTEGLLSPHYAPLGLRLIRDMLKRYPALYSWGHGGHEAAMLQLLVALKWTLHATPFCLRVCRPFRFLRGNRYLRDSPRNRLLLDLLAYSGLGEIGLRTLHLLLGLRGESHRDVQAEVVPRFDVWADSLWDQHRDEYLALGKRDAETMNLLVPDDAWPHGIRLRVTRAGRDLGWAVVTDNQLHDDPRFGDLRVGCIADAFAAPRDAGAVVAAASRFLIARGVDMIGSNQAHPAWITGFAEAGYLILDDRRKFAVSPALQALLEPFDETKVGLHLTNMDGHGPHGF